MRPPVDLAEVAARVLARGAVERSRAPLDAETVQLVASAIRARRRSRRLAWGLGGLAAAAAVVVTVSVAGRNAGSPVAKAPEVPSVSAGTTGGASSATASSVDAVTGGAEIVRTVGRSSLSRGGLIARGDEIIV